MMKRIALCFCSAFLLSSAIAAEKPATDKPTAATTSTPSTATAAKEGASAAPMGTQNISSYMPKSDKVTGSVMKLSISQEYMDIAQKLQKAIQANQAWFMEYSKAAKPDAPLPYDEKMGITKEEYQKLIDADKNVKLVEEKKIDIAFTKMADGKIKITTTPTSPIDKIIIDEKVGVTTDHGLLKDATVVNNQDKNSVTGPWKGMQWKTESMNEAKKEAKSIKFAIGALENQDQNIVYYDVLDMGNGKKEQYSYIIFYPKS